MTKRKYRFVHCRLSEADFERFHEHAEELELAPSEYLRYIIRIPVKTGEGSGKVVALDTKTMPQIYGELVRWGHHYNQAVHALNTTRSSPAAVATTSTTSSSSSSALTVTWRM